MHAGCAAERRDADARVVRQRGHLRDRARVPRLGQRVLDERCVRLVRFRDREFRLRDHIEAAKAQQAAEFAQLALVAGG